MKKNIPTYKELEKQKQMLENEVHELRKQLNMQTSTLSGSVYAFAISNEVGVITSVNSSFIQMWAYENEDQIKEVSFFSLWKNEDQIQRIIQTLKTTSNWDGKLSAKRKDGTYLDIRLSISPVMDGSNVPTSFFVAVVDQTEQSRLFEELRVNEERLQMTLAVTQIGIWDWNIKKDLWYASPIYYTMLGYEAVFGHGNRTEWLERVHPDDLINVTRAIQQVLQYESKSYLYEARMRHADGTYRWQKVIGHAIEFDENNNISRLIGVRIDINNSKLNELLIKQKNEEIKIQNDQYLQINEELLQTNFELQMAKEEIELSATMFKAIFENSQDAIGISKNGINFLTNGAFVELFKCNNANEFVGKSILEHISPKEHPKIIQYIERRAKGLYVPNLYETVGLKTDGKEFPVEIKVGSYTLNEENYSIAIIRDITERKEHEDKLNQSYLELKRAMEKAEESDQLKTAFLQNLSHEIRTPMNAIVGFSKMIEKPDLSIEKRKNYISIIVNSSDQLLSIVSDIMTISSITTQQEKVNIKKTCINHITNELFENFKSQASDQNISLLKNLQFADDESEVYTDETKLTQILRNLLDNALKFTTEGFVEFGYVLKNELLEFYVKDSGTGIQTEMQTKIFERFRQENENISKKYGGTGLGLAISKAFVELLGGLIWVDSEQGKGSTFYFTIPYQPAKGRQHEGQ